MKLSSLKPGKLYYVNGDEVDASLQVITPGLMPTCIMKGHIFGEFAPDDREVFMQLIGWVTYGESAITTKGIQLFIADTQPEHDNLLAVLSDGQGGSTTLLFPSVTIEAA